jgi:hypothetical protein
MEAINIIAYPKNNSQIEAIKAVMKALKIKFEVSKDLPYNPEFMAKIEKSEKEIKEGKTILVKKGDFKEFLGL